MLAQVADGASYDSPVFEALAAEEVWVDGLTADKFPQRSGWNLEPYLVVTEGYTLGDLDATCECPACDSATATCSLAWKAEVDSVDITISLGADVEGSLGSLTVRAEKPSPLLARPEGLALHVSGKVRSIVDYDAPLIGSTADSVAAFSFAGSLPAFDPDAFQTTPLGRR